MRLNVFFFFSLEQRAAARRSRKESARKASRSRKGNEMNSERENAYGYKIAPAPRAHSREITVF